MREESVSTLRQEEAEEIQRRAAAARRCFCISDVCMCGWCVRACVSVCVCVCGCGSLWVWV